MSRDVHASADAARDARLAVILGSGLGGASEGYPREDATPFEAIEGAGRSHVAGHAGEVVRCRVGGRGVLFVRGRRHAYEGDDGSIRALVRYLRDEGVERLVLTSAAGSLRRSLEPGDWVLVDDLIDLQQRSPLRPGAVAPPLRAAPLPDPTGSAVGDRPGRGAKIDPALRDALQYAAERAGVPLSRGVLVCMAGPTYESVSEVAFLQRVGGSVVTMSAAAEIAAANEFGMAVASIALVTNWGTGISADRLQHGDVLAGGRVAVGSMRRLVEALVARGEA